MAVPASVLANLIKFSFLYQAIVKNVTEEVAKKTGGGSVAGLPEAIRVVDSVRLSDKLAVHQPVLGTLHEVSAICDEEAFTKCNAKAKYRSLDGTCNNLAHPTWGAAGIRLRRVVAPSYGDGKSEPRGGRRSASKCNNAGDGDGDDGRCRQVGSRALPNPREVSTAVLGAADRPNSGLTLLLAYFGQFVAHDVTETKEEEGEDATSCCEKDKNENCVEVKNCDSDPVTECWTFPRSASPCKNNDNGQREQINILTAFIDASNVYGADDETSKALRAFEGGLLKESSEGLLPSWDHDQGAKKIVLASGDRRVDDVPGLLSMHTLFLREHNRVARDLAETSTITDDETLYQEARRIVIAELQNVVYDEYLTALGLDSLLPASGKHSKSYNSSRDPSIANSFATAAYRFGHSLVQGIIRMESHASKINPPPYDINDHFMDPTASLYKSSFVDILYSFTKMCPQTLDMNLVDNVREGLFSSRNGGRELPDLPARNIQRGRDHGLPGYNEFRKFCHLKPSCSWGQIPNEIREGVWNKFEEFYQDPDDIDLFPALLAETPEKGKIFGPTLSCLLSYQFKGLMAGDRFFFTNDKKSNPHPFTAEQLANIGRRTLSDIMCDNLPIQELPRQVFIRDSPIRSCALNHRLDIELFSGATNEDEEHHHHGLSLKELYNVKHVCRHHKVRCDPSLQFRTISGLCNNLANPAWGAAGTALRRLLRAQYQTASGGANAPRGGYFAHAQCDRVNVNSRGCAGRPGAELPNPRRVSLALHRTEETDDAKTTLLFTYFGQFLAHDTDLTPQASTRGTCCKSRSSRDLSPDKGSRDFPNGDENCFPILSGCGDDPLGEEHRCFELARSWVWCGESHGKTREQVNIVTSFVDASNVYGSDKKTAEALRTLQGGMLKVSQSHQLPFVEESSKSSGEAVKRLFIAGDERVRVVPGLTAVHALFVLEHNRVAKELSKHLPGESDDLLYEVSRAVVIAEMQNIAFGQYLEVLLGENFVNATTTYLPKLDPSVSNEFATAAFRFGHSMVQSRVKLMGSNKAKGDKMDSYRVRDHYKDPNAFVYRNNFQSLLLSFTRQASQTCDLNFAEDLRDELFLSDEERRGRLSDANAAVGVPDLAARNIQRGRDHGIRPYMYYRRACRLYRKGDCSWSRGPAEIPRHIWATFKSLYESPSDVDLFSAGLAERPKEGSVVGPTFHCIIAEQFRRLRDGDRFFFTHGNGAQKWLFARGVEKQLRSRHLGSILCDLFPELTSLPSNVFSRQAPAVDCADAAKIDLAKVADNVRDEILYFDDGSGGDDGKNELDFN